MAECGSPFVGKDGRLRVEDETGCLYLIADRPGPFRKAFAGFDSAQVARFGEDDVVHLMADPGIVRAQAKIRATIAGARIYCEMAERGESFADFCWSFTDGRTIKNPGREWMAQSPLSAAVSKEMKRRGFKFVGPTIVYAWMQAVGIVNDHAAGCFRREEV